MRASVSDSWINLTPQATARLTDDQFGIVIYQNIGYSFKNSKIIKSNLSVKRLSFCARTNVGNVLGHLVNFQVDAVFKSI